MTAPHALAHFALLTFDEQRQAIKKLAASGATDGDISRLTGLHVQQIRKALAEHNGSEVRP